MTNRIFGLIALIPLAIAICLLFLIFDAEFVKAIVVTTIVTISLAIALVTVAYSTMFGISVLITGER